MQQQERFVGTVVLVTGANGGLGSYVTRAFLDAGETVVGVSRKIQQSEFENPAFTAVSAEISTAAGTRAMIDSLVARLGRLDVVVHTVGDCTGIGMLEGANLAAAELAMAL